jgi:hypothetical protein
MIVICALIAAALVIGVVTGVIAVVSLGIRREEREFTLTSDSEDRMVRGARRLTGLYTRTPDRMRQRTRRWEDTPV